MNYPKSPGEIEALKANWRSDPCWDIADTEGFEAHREELEAYQRQCEAEWAQRAKNRVYDLAELLGCSPDTAKYIERLESRLDRMTEEINTLKDRANQLERDLGSATESADRANRRVRSLNHEIGL